MQTTLARRRIYTALVAGALAASAAQAQQKPLQWQPMREAAFHSPYSNPTASAQEHALLQKIWARELADAGEMSPGTPYPSAVLMGTVETPAARLVFSSYARARYDKCQPAENGANVEYSHWVCPLRVARTEGNKLVVRDLPGYCIVWGNDPDAPREKNHVEYAYDAKSATLRFRTIEHGKVLPRCSRSLRLQG